MSRIDDLIRELCPDGVPFKTLGEVSDYSRTRVDAALLDAHSFVGVDNLRRDRGGRVESAFAPSTGQVSQYLPGDVLIGNIRPYLKKIWLAAGCGGHSADVLSVRIRSEYVGLIEARFLYQLLAADMFFAYNTKFAKGAAMPRGDKAMILKYKIPVPPVEVQREILRVLDGFQSLEAELEAELEARRRQYAYYRDRLLTFTEAPQSVRWVPVGELGTIFRGKRFTKDDYVESGGIGVIHYGEIYTDYGVSATRAVSRVRDDLSPSLRYATKGDVVLTDVGETAVDVGKAVAWLGDEDVAIHDHCYVIRSSLDASYLSYVMQTNAFLRAKDKHIARTKVKTLLLDGLRRIAVPVPPLDEQRRIVSILDKFDVLVNDLSIGLPAELEARRQQYGYYRDRLLTFREAA